MIKCLFYIINLFKQVGKKYIFSNLSVTVVNKKFNCFPNVYGLQLKENSEIVIDDSNDNQLPINKYNFVKIKDIASYEVESKIGMNLILLFFLIIYYYIKILLINLYFNLT